MVDLVEIPEPWRALVCWRPWGPSKNKRLEDHGYLLDQALHRLRIPYFMEMQLGVVGREFVVFAAEGHEGVVARVIARISGHPAQRLPAPRARTPGTRDSAGSGTTELSTG